MATGGCKNTTHKMSTEQKPFEFCLNIKPVIKRSHGKNVAESFSNDYAITLFKELKYTDRRLERILVEGDKQYLHIKKVEDVGAFEDLVKLKCYVVTESDLDDLNEALKHKRLSKSLTEYGYSIGLGIGFNIRPNDNDTEFELRVSFESILKYHEGKIHFNSSDTSGGSAMSHATINSPAETQNSSRSKSEYQGTAADSGGMTVKHQNKGENQKENKFWIIRNFYLYVPVESCYIHSVTINSEDVKELNGLVMKNQPIGLHLWFANVSMPPDIEEFTYRFTINYTHKAETVYLKVIKWKVKDEKTITSGEYFYEQSDQLTSHFHILEMFSDEDFIHGYEEFCLHIFSNVNEANLKECIMQLESLHKKVHLKQLNHVCKVVQNIQLKYGSTFHRTKYLAFTAFLCLAFKNLRQINEHNCVQSEFARNILYALRKSSLEEIPSYCQKRFVDVVTVLCQRLNKEDFSVLSFMYDAYPFLSPDHFITMLDSNVQLLKTQPSSVATQSMVSKVLMLLYQHICEKDSANSVQRLLEKILTHLPMRIFFHTMNELESSNVCNTERFKEVFERSKEKLHYRCKTELQTLSSSMERLLEFWQNVRSHRHIETSQLSTTMEDSLLTALTETDDKGYEKLRNICLDDDLFTEHERKMNLLSRLADSKSVNIHHLVIILLKEEKFKSLDKSEIEKLAKTWFECVMRKHFVGRKPPQAEYIPDLYYYLSELLSVQIIKENTNLTSCIENMAFQFLQSVNIKDVIKKIKEIEEYSDETIEVIYRSHVQKLLFQSRGSRAGSKTINIILQEICGTTCLRVNSGLTLGIVETLLELTGITPSMPDEEVLMIAINATEFWKKVSNVSGLKKNSVKAHPSYKKVDKAIDQMVQQLTSDTIECKTLKKMENKIEGLLDILSCKNSTHKMETTLKKAYKCLATFVHDCELTISVLQKCRPNISAGIMIDSVVKTIEALSCIEGDLHKGSVQLIELKSKSFFDPLFPEITESCNKLKDIIESRVFWNVTKNKLDESLIIEEKFEESEEDDVLKSLPLLFDPEYKKDDENSLHVNIKIVNQLLHYLVDKGILSYHTSWEPYTKGKDVGLLVLEKQFQESSIDTEIKIVKEIYKRLDTTSLDALLMYADFEKHGVKVTAMKSALTACNIDASTDTEFSSAMSSFEQLCNSSKTEEDLERITLFNIYKSLKTVEKVTKKLDEETTDILLTVGQSQSLMEFLTDVADDDIRNLIDAVEEHSEQYVQESTVSSLIDVKRVFQPILKKSFKNDLIEFFLAIAKSSYSSGIKGIPHKINECMDNLHSLKALYKNVANRGERTKEIVDNVVKKGKFHFILADKTCHLKVEYKQDKKTVAHSESGLNDLRSRALLIMNTEEKRRSMAKTEPKVKDFLSLFVQHIDTAFEIAQILKHLQFSGHFSYTTYDQKVGQKELSCVRDMLHTEYNAWCYMLNICRSKFYFMNFIYSEQLQLLYQYFEKGSNEKLVVAVLKYIHPDADTSESDRAFYKSIALNDMNNPTSILECLGRTLNSILQHTKAMEREFMIPKTSTKLSETVQESKLFVAALEEGSHFTVRTILALYLNTTGHLPEAHQILVCNSHTTWDEILLLLQRCIGAFANRSTKELFCIANVEMIASDLQFMLVDELRSLPRDLKYFLFLVCRGNERHPFFDQFRECILHPRPLTDAQMKTCFGKQWQNVFTVTSDIPGLGKTEYVKQQALCKSMDISALHISGPFEKKSLVERLSKLKIRTNSILHIDIGMVDSPVELDSFLFELITLGCVTAGTKSFFLPTKNVYIEVANTLNQSLCNCLPTVTSFKRTNLKWEGYKNFRVSMEVNSPVQVVCNYLKCIEEGVLNKTDLSFVGHNTIKPLAKEICQQLLQKHFVSVGDLSFTLVNIFLNVLSDQLKKLSASVYFRIANLSAMLGEKKVHNVKSNLVLALVDVSKEFSARSIHSCRSTQAASLSSDESKPLVSAVSTSLTAAEVLALRVEGMIRWEDSNHLMILFHQDGQTISALYRDKQKVPEHVKHLIESQINRKLEDFHLKTQTELQLVLQRLSRSKQQPKIEDKTLTYMAQRYALTPDNLLKMVLVTLRIKAHVPVIIMGETGCGKTSLVRYLADMCGITFKVLSIHAGVTQEMIVKNVTTTNDEARKDFESQIWMFLDEINTCDHLGLICDIVCHHKCLGTTLAPNIVFMAACNPYRLRDEKSVFTAGLQGKIKSDELSRLVYRVHPLPETMVDFVWDFGSLSEKDEHSYICRMVQTTFEDKTLNDLLSDLLTESQRFVRSKEGTESCVSLRDVDRCKRLVSWFIKTLKEKELLVSTTSFCYTFNKGDREIAITSVILALALCYHSRFSDKTLRTQYRKVISDIVIKHVGSSYGINTERSVAEIIQREQKDIIDRMELPEGTAKNTALQENVFVILVCILNRIPVFLVGKPGCSKSLSMQLIRSNLRGMDSRDKFFQSLPQLYCVSFQGSESSTSDGIIKVFVKAKKYQEHNKIEDVMSVVILDEIGLAEISRFNPLKVLHGLLEPENKIVPDVAVVGLSNWALDAAKMNRAIHLSRPEMDEEELYETGISISESIFSKPEKLLTMPKTRSNLLPYKIKKILKAIALAYHECNTSQNFKNFHGLRDFYSLNKHLSRTLLKIEMSDDKLVSEVLTRGLLRNFGGLPSELKSIVGIFQKHLNRDLICNIHVIDLIKENLFDQISRHLMLITSGDAVTSKVEQLLRQNGREYMVIYGSQFEEDLTDDYNYRILSRIILCMEQGLVLILKDLESIYGSLYDMLNQNYTVVGKKKNCRVALGPYSNPMCQVHDDFKCIVLVEERKLDYSDPPFLNRFEKQQFRFSDILDDTDSEIISLLEQFIQEFCEIEHHHFTPFDAFPVYSPDMLASLVLHLKSKINECPTILEKAELCFKQLLDITTPEAIVRIKKSALWNEANEFAREMHGLYLSKPLHNGFDHYISSQIDQVKKDRLTEYVEINDYLGDQLYDLNNLKDKENHSSNQSQTAADNHESLFVVFTHSNIHIDMKECTGSRNIQIEKVGSFKTEKHLHSRLQHFFGSDNDILVLQVSAKEDASHILLTKSTVETLNLTFQKETKLEKSKYVFMVIHLERKHIQLNPVTQLNFLSGWKMVTLDSLEKPKIQLPDIIDMTVLEVLKSRRPLYHCIKGQLFWAFTRIHYSSSRRSIGSMKKLLNQIQLNDEFLNDMEHVIFEWIDDEMEKEMGSMKTMDWQVDIACNELQLSCATTFMDALEGYILEMIKHPLAKVIYRLEDSNAAECYFIQDSNQEDRRKFWRNLVLSSNFLQLNELKQPTGPECYNCTTPALKMKMPFSQIIITKVEQLKNDFLDTLSKLKSCCDIEDEVPLAMFLDLASRYQDIVMQEVGEMLGLGYEGKNEDYVHDYCMSIISQTASNVDEKLGETFLKWEFSNYINCIEDFGALVTHLHTAFWTYSSTMLSMLQLVGHSNIILGNEVIRMLQVNPDEKDVVLSWLLEDDITKSIENQHKPNATSVTTYTITQLETEGINDTEDDPNLKQEDLSINNAENDHNNGASDTLDTTYPDSYQSTKLDTGDVNDTEDDHNNGASDTLDTTYPDSYQSTKLETGDVNDTENDHNNGASDTLDTTNPDLYQSTKLETGDVNDAEDDHNNGASDTLDTTYSDSYQSTKLETGDVKKDDPNYNKVIGNIDTSKSDSYTNVEQVTGEFISQNTKVLEDSIKGIDDNVSQAADKNLYTTTETEGDISVDDIKPEFYDDISGLHETVTEDQDLYEPFYDNSRNLTDTVFPEKAEKIFEKNEKDTTDDNKEKWTMTMAGYKDMNLRTSLKQPELNDDSVASDEEPITNRETLLKYICSHIFPTRKLIDKLTFASWKQILSNMLPLLGNLSLELEDIYKLRFCNDVANVLIIPNNLPVDILIVFGNHLQHEALNSEDMFKLLMNQMYDLHENHHISGVQLQRIINLYIGRCIACDPDSDIIMKNILTYISNRNLVDPKLSFLGPIFRHLILIEMSEEKEEDDALKNMLMNENIENNLLCDIDNYLIKLDEEEHNDSVLPALLIDVLESVFIEDLDLEYLRAIESSSDEIISSALAAHQLLHDGCFNLRFLLSVAYLRAFMKNFSSLIGDNLADMEEFTVLCNNINPMLTLGTDTELFGDRSKDLLIYMLKCFVYGNENMGLLTICKNAASLLPNFDKIDWNFEFSLLSMEYSPFSVHCLEGYSECISILKELDLDDAKVNTFVSNAVVSKTRLIVFIGAILNRYTIRKTYLAVTDLEKLYSETLLTVIKTKLDNKDQYRLLEYATGKKDFGHGIYNFTSETPEDESYVASVMLHLLCILTVYEYKDSVLYKCMTKPTLKQLNATLHQDREESTILAGYLCDCGYRYVSRDDECPVCTSRGNKKEVVSQTGISKWLSPVSRGITQLFVNGCILNSLALHFSKKEDLLEMLGLETGDDVAEEIQERVFTEWRKLKLLLGVNNKDLCGLCNIILYRCHSLMVNPTESVAELEELLLEVIDEHLQRKFSLLQEMRCKVYQANNVDPDAFECHLDEVTKVHHDSDDKKFLYQPSFFRVTGTPTLENLHAELYTGSTYKSYPFLCLVLQNLQQLSMPQYITPLLRWHLHTVSLASYTIRKVECKEVSIGKLITKARNEKAKNILRKSFKQFENAWNKLKEDYAGVMKLIKPDMPTMQLISAGSKVSQCIVMDNSSPLYVVLCTLAQIQNMFLDEALQVVAQNECPSINFVNANEQSVWISAVPLMNLEDKDVIKYTWTDDVLRYSQCETEFGHGNKIHYDFPKIEMELAQEIMYRKPYIALPKALTQILFTDELFHNSVNLMKEVQSSIPQEQLSSEIINGIQRKKDKDITESLTLLGMVLTILKKTGGDGSLPLVEFIDHWKDIILQSSFKQLLPEPEHCVKLCHIVALYEWFEEQNGESVFESLDDDFRIPLTDDAKNKLEDNASNSIRLLEKLGRCLKVFVHRCLSSKDSDIDREQPLIDYICDPAFWQEGIFDGYYIIMGIGQPKVKLIDVISKTLMVEHIYAAISFIQDKIEEHKEKDQRISSMAASYQASNPDKALTSKRRRTARKGFGKT